MAYIRTSKMFGFYELVIFSKNILETNIRLFIFNLLSKDIKTNNDHPLTLLFYFLKAHINTKEKLSRREQISD